MRGGAGNDTLNGNGGTSNRAEYQDVTAGTGIKVTLAGVWGAQDSSVVGGVGVVDTDTLQQINLVRGTNIDSTAVGTGDIYTVSATFEGSPGQGGFNEFEGFDGDDTINGNGNTRASYLNADAGVAISLNGNGAGSAVSTDGAVLDSANVGTDTFSSGVRTARGSSFDDTYVVDANFEIIPGAFTSGGGFNQFEGRGGDDTIIGSGHTQVDYHAAAAAVTVTLATGGTGTATSTAGGDASCQGTDTFFTGVNQIRGSAFGDNLNGSDDVGAYGGIVITPSTDVVYLFNVASGTLVADDFAFV